MHRSLSAALAACALTAALVVALGQPVPAGTQPPAPRAVNYDPLP